MRSAVLTGAAMPDGGILARAGCGLSESRMTICALVDEDAALIRKRNGRLQIWFRRQLACR